MLACNELHRYLPAVMAEQRVKEAGRFGVAPRGGVQPQAAKSATRQRIRSFGSLLVIALSASLLSLYFFTPRVVLWKGLHIEPAQRSPEVARAVDALTQLSDPFVKIENTSNIVLQWRLLFPLIGHFLHVPATLYLLIPHLGCVVTLMYIAHVSMRFVSQTKQVFLVTVWLATASWFFVSTGWLSYEDSWTALGLLLVSFSGSRTSLVLSCLLEPFIDERFVLMIPLALAVRCAVMSDAESVKRLRVDFRIIIGLLAPYVLLRIGVLTRDHGSTFYLTNRASELRQHTTWTQYLVGPWMGLRLLWIAVASAIFSMFRARRRLAGAFLLVTVLMCVALTLVIAADLSRTMSSALPAALLGALLLVRDYPQTMTWGLPLLVAGNLLLPAWHVVTVFNEPIFYCYAELNELNHPPPEVDAETYLEQAEILVRSGQQAEAEKAFEYAWRLNPEAVNAVVTEVAGKSRASMPASTEPLGR